MPTVLVFGGFGKVAQHLTRVLHTESPTSYQVYSVIRDADQVTELKKLGAKPICKSIEHTDVSEFISMLRDIKPDVVVWSAGARSDGEDGEARTLAVDRDGAIKAMDACAAADIRRFIMVSAMDVRDHSKPVPSWYDEGTTERAAKVYKAARTFMEAKYSSEKELVMGNDIRGLNYTIVRPAGLGIQPGTGKVSAGRVQLAKVVKREDLARVILCCIENEGTIGLSFDVAAGDQPVAEAVEGVVGGKIDVFREMY